MLQLLSCFFAPLLILECPDHHQNLISSSLYYPGPRPKSSSQSVHSFLSNVVHKQTNKQTNRQTDKPTPPKHNLLCQGGNKQWNPPAVNVSGGIHCEEYRLCATASDNILEVPFEKKICCVLLPASL